MTHWWYKLRLWVWNCASGFPSWHVHRYKQAQKRKPDVFSQTNVWYRYPPELVCFNFNLENWSHRNKLRFCTGRGIIGMLFTCGNRTSVHPCPAGLKCTSGTVTQVQLVLFPVAVDPTLPFKTDADFQGGYKYLRGGNLSVNCTSTACS